MARFGSLVLLSIASVVSAFNGQEPLIDKDASSVGKSLVDTEKLQSMIDGDKLLARAEDLYKLAELSWHEYNRPTRVIGDAGHAATLDYIWATLSKLGTYYNVSQQTFPAVLGYVSESRLVLDDEVIKNATAMSLTPPTKDKEPVQGDLILVKDSGCDASDYSSSVRGNIAFIQRGQCAFGKKSSLAGEAGAVAAVIYNNEKGLFGGTLGDPEADHVASFSISLEEAQPYIKELQDGGSVSVIAYIDAEVKTIGTNNIIAETVQGDKDNCVMLGAHSDSVEAGPGINDDGSGTLSLLEVATALTSFSVNNCVRFAWWAGEEEGLLGSNYYAGTLSPKENQKVRLFMDYDMMGSPNFAYQIYNATNDENPAGSEELRDLYVDWYKKHGLNYTFIPFDGRSDYDGFIRAGIPAGGVATGAEGVKTKEEAGEFGGKPGDWYDPCYHQLCDNVGNVNMTAWIVNTKLIAHSVATYAASFEGFPERKIELDIYGKPTEYGAKHKYRGSELFV
ncbi:hypothetical protein AC579_2565 [Pseudocercospora musae]|uniref:Peptide hydrolase n=1 Tax=Pseudocercospora musae TaxID=113226 RepID=A0A139HFA2_9PEZI|nr:hypothetical protein AC579_2565 [Pseudocercospora musae]